MQETVIPIADYTEHSKAMLQTGKQDDEEQQSHSSGNSDYYYYIIHSIPNQMQYISPVLLLFSNIS